MNTIGSTYDAPRNKIVCHVAYNSVLCRHWYLYNVSELDVEIVENLDRLEFENNRVLRSLGHGPRYSPFAPYRISGPLPRNVLFG